ncbi:hypothetical protein C1H87_18640 [Flavivirga eckloniae]|uniref:Alpha/beta hydrolase n=1 Tax=Flavivirga eckloniae TaxID=1803846 RepID=A0A2K9PU75_9FLAO|nr:hypothetical protein C1H87_18640 [Flavivirga eckloniae]
MGVFYSCSKSENKALIVPETRNLFFESSAIDIKRTETGYVTANLKYTGTALNTPLTVQYSISQPNQDAAVEDVDFELPATSGTVVIPVGKNSVTTTLIKSILKNPEVGTKSVSFNLQPLNDFILGKPNKQEGSSILVNITEGLPIDNDPDDRIGDKKMAITVSGNTFKIPYFSNVTSIDDENTSITRAVIALQGANRNAGLYYENMLVAAKMESMQLDTLLVVSPQFLVESEIVDFRLDSEHLYWSSGGWKIGFLSKNEAQNPRPGRVSSFTMIDSLMTLLVKKNPNLKTIVFSGHSAGGQFVNRYAAASPIPTELKNSGVNVRFIVNNPSSYVYMDNTRIVPGTTDFEIPQTSCITFNEYKYGLDDLPNYLTAVGADQIRTQFAKREVLYLLGEEDNNPNSSSLDKSCEAALQGNQRLERGMNYFQYLQSYYGDAINNTQSIGTVPGVGHSHSGMFQSEQGRFYAFRK